MLSGVLSSIRLSGSLQFCFMPAGDWQTDDKPAFNKGESSAGVMPFHIMVEGSCWLKMPEHNVDLVPGDIVAFPFGTGHQLGHGKGGGMVNPTTLLPPKPWREIPGPALRRRDRRRCACCAATCSATPWTSGPCARRCRRCCI